MRLPWLSNHASDGDDVLGSTPVQVKEPGGVILAAQSTLALRHVLLYLVLHIYILDVLRFFLNFLIIILWLCTLKWAIVVSFDPPSGVCALEICIYVSWLDIKCIQRAAPKSWSEFNFKNDTTIKCSVKKNKKLFNTDFKHGKSIKCAH